MPYSAARTPIAATSGGSVAGGGITTASAGCASARRNPENSPGCYDFEYPARPGTAPNRALPPLTSIAPATLSPAALGSDRIARGDS